MSASLPNGALIAIGSAYGSAITVSGITNANPGVATATAHGLTNGDVIVVSSGWSRLDGKTVRVANITTNTFELEGIDTTATAIYPASSGGGTVKKVTTFTQISQILSSTTDGGQQNFLEYQYLESDAQTRVPTFKSPNGLTLGIADDPTLPGYTAISAANDDRVQRAIRVSLPNGSKIYYYGYVSLNKTPSLNVNQLMEVQATLSFSNEPVRYTA